MSAANDQVDCALQFSVVCKLHLHFPIAYTLFTTDTLYSIIIQSFFVSKATFYDTK